MNRIDIKPLSVNEAWQGKRFKTEECKRYCKDVYFLLPRIQVPKEGKLEVYYEFGVSSVNFDYDNGIKIFQDVLQKRYGFNDSKIYRSTQEKVITKKGQEYIKFHIAPYGELIYELLRIKHHKTSKGKAKANRPDGRPKKGV